MNQVSDPIDSERLKKDLCQTGIGANVIVVQETTSTNDLAADYARLPGHHGWVIMAEYQKTGRGRQGHQWVSGPGQSLLCSILLINCPIRANLLSLTVPVAVAEALGPEARIKWPNDILLQDKKAGGILIERYRYPSHEAFVVGIGINCHQCRDDFPEDLQDRAISMDMACHRWCDRTDLARRLFWMLAQALETARYQAQTIMDRWSRLCIQIGQYVTVKEQGRCYRGTCVGIDPMDGLIVNMGQSGLRMFDPSTSHLIETH